MRKKDIKKIADILKKIRPVVAHHTTNPVLFQFIVEEFLKSLQEDNPAFDQEKFWNYIFFNGRKI